MTGEKKENNKTASEREREREIKKRNTYKRPREEGEREREGGREYTKTAVVVDRFFACVYVCILDKAAYIYIYIYLNGV